MIKFAKSDIHDGLVCIKVGINNIINSIINKEVPEYSVEIPLRIDTLQDIIKFAIPEAFVSYNYNKEYTENSKLSLYVLINNSLIEVLEEENNYKFVLIK